MKLIRWHKPGLSNWAGFGRLPDFQEEIDRLFGAPFSNLARHSRFLDGSTPPLDVTEDKDNFFVKVELPGLKKEDIEISLHDDSLNISGERKHEAKYEGAKAYRTERFVGRFQRSVALPAPVASDKVKADYKDGLLTVTLPKTEEAKPKQIDVQVN